LANKIDEIMDSASRLSDSINSSITEQQEKIKGLYSEYNNLKNSLRDLKIKGVNDLKKLTAGLVTLKEKGVNEIQELVAEIAVLNKSLS
jgi:MoaA/NifB/PqqE/SkfB family radical SAM enzyme